MTWYKTILSWVFVIGIAFTILKYAVPKPFWVWCENAIINWQLSATMQQYEVMQHPKKKAKLWFMIGCIVAGSIVGWFTSWWKGMIVIIALYFFLGVVFMQMGWIADD